MVIFARKDKLRALIFFHKNIGMISFAILIADDYHCYTTIMIKCLAWAQYDRLLISNFASNDSLAFENGLDGELAILLKSAG
jgi:hypothetical protein